MRRIRTVWLLTCAVIASAAGYGADIVSTRSMTTTPTAGVTSVVLPASAPYEQLAIVDGKLVLSNAVISVGEVYGQPLGWDAPNGQSCVMSVIAPLTLKTSVATACPALAGERIAVTSVPTTSIGSFANCGPENASVVPLRLGPGGSVTKDPVVMEYGLCSDAHLVVAYGAGSVWVYDCATGSPGRHGQLVRLSATTGMLENTIALPSFVRPVVAADAGGFWIGPSNDSLGPDNGPVDAIYHVASGSNSASLVLHWDGPVSWMLGTGTSMYVDVETHNEATTGELWRFGDHPTDRTLVNDHLAGLAQWMVGGDAAEGCFGLNDVGIGRPTYSNAYSGPTYPIYRDEVVWLDPETGATRVLTWIGPADNNPQLVYAHGAAYVLSGNRLYRVTP